MRKISVEAHDAFVNEKRFNKSNTRVEIIEGNPMMFLFDNLIAKKENGEIFVCDGGYGPSNTTRDRLNAFPEIWLGHKKGQWTVGKGIHWDGNWTNIKLLEECMYEER